MSVDRPRGISHYQKRCEEEPTKTPKMLLHGLQFTHLDDAGESSSLFASCQRTPILGTRSASWSPSPSAPPSVRTDTCASFVTCTLTLASGPSAGVSTYRVSQNGFTFLTTFPSSPVGYSGGVYRGPALLVLRDWAGLTLATLIRQSHKEAQHMQQVELASWGFGVVGNKFCHTLYLQEIWNFLGCSWRFPSPPPCARGRVAEKALFGHLPRLPPFAASFSHKTPFFGRLHLGHVGVQETAEVRGAFNGSTRKRN